MSQRASVSAAIATLALSLGALAPAGAAHAATCNAAPKSPPPQGSHWYYRTDRGLGRKCWYLASEGRKGQSAPRAAATDDDEDANAEPAAAPNEPAAPMAEVAARLTAPLRGPPPQPPAADWTIAATPSAPLLAAPPEPAPSRDAAAAPVVQPAVANTEPVEQPAAPAVAPAPPAVPAAAPTPERINLTQFVFVAFVGLCLLAGLFLYLAAIRRRREIRIVDLNPASLRMSAALTDSPSVAPDRVRDDREEPPRRSAQARRRQTA